MLQEQIVIYFTSNTDFLPSSTLQKTWHQCHYA